MRRLFVVSALAASVALAWWAQPASAQAPAPAAAWSASDCAGCHEQAVGPAFARSAHAKDSLSCASCHENVADHLRAQTAGEAGGPVPSVGKLTANQVNTMCLSCHEKAGQASYLSGLHARRNVSCSDCHGIHQYKSIRAQLKTQLDSETCATCHKSVRAQTMKTSHHPVREGKMSCSICHNPHEGDKPAMMHKESVSEQCYDCHAEKRGPFVFEHAPVKEDCSLCHNPHGSNHKRLLVQKEPSLCWNCHFTGSGHFGSGDNFSTEKGVPTAPPGSPSGYPTVNSRFIGRSCSKCHTNIHGSNSPSGAYFVR